MMSEMRRAAAPLRDLYLKYLSEVGYLRRDLHWHISRISERGEIARREFLASQIRLETSDAAIVESMNTRGLVKVRLDAVCPESQLLPYLRSRAAKYGEPSFEDIASQRTGFSKYYWANVWEPPDRGTDPLLEFACNRRVISIVAKYLGQVPILQDVNFFYSPANRGRVASPIGSQGWHLDCDQKTRVKIFLSPFRITRRSGPTTCLPLPHSDARLYRNYPGYFNDQQAAEFGLETGQRIEMLSDPGEFHFADTSRLFHFGSRDVQDPRWLTIITYGPVECYLRQKNRRKLYGPENRFFRQNKRIVESFEPAAGNG